MVICKLEAANKALLFGKDMDGIDLDASEQAESRVAALREQLPPTSSARRLTERSDLKDAHEVLQQQLLNLHSVWQEQSIRVEQERAQHERALGSKHAELQECQAQLQERCEDLETVMQEKLMGAAEAQGLRDQLLEAEVLFARLQEQSQSDTRCLAHTASELREQVLAVQAELERERSRNQERLSAAQTELEHERLRNQERLSAAQTELERERSRNQERLLAAQTELEHERSRNQEQLLAVRAEMEQQQQITKERHAQEVTSLEADQALTRQELQRHIAALELELQGSTTQRETLQELQRRIAALELELQGSTARRERAEALQRDAWQQNQDLQEQADKAADRLVQENAKLLEEKMNLKIVVDEAEKQLQLMHQDLQGVKKQQHMALRERQRQSEELAKRGLAKDPGRQSLPQPHCPPRPKKKPSQQGKPWILV
ncbi:hypothetical protein DUNSADRAFT_11949 [Dunaliella salina]|uniref:Uncharacterized protein n=1 Tax=Dunaliella salina TaxID=3046 RepID=A0ABQ7GCC8_DUNSA|nr:hypothetical protein DUNSADRAFT_11949 [Dunaliella salina]|eukprot:KAF5832249.1 hypothetical protein DUNSADRAFT_11949 [Dunaliella salina]